MQEGGKTILLRPFRRIGAIMPASVITYFENELRFAGIRHEAIVWLGLRAIFSFMMGGLALFVFLIIANPPPTEENIIIASFCWLVGFVLSLILFYLLLYFRITDRASALEKILPDFLLLTVSNLRAGMTPSEAFLQAARPEFGDLHKEVRLSAAKASGTVSLEDALKDMGNYFDSRLFRRIIILFTKGMQSGGQLGTLLRAAADEVQHMQDLRAELATSTRTYTLFLGFITILVMPFLLSISTIFVDVFVKLQPDYNGESGIPGGVPMFSGKIFITPDEMRMMAIVTLVLTSLLVSCLAGIIRKGKALYGIKYFPIFAIASVIFFFIAYQVIEKMLVGFTL
ncbi:type II secretion system F family protein [Candidatus Micrarchaeota archaeon]|nr:type II secretion system F family protein [Candidatus Micrarchaeota archaeon]